MNDLKHTLSGIIGVVNTPFDASGAIHTASLRSYVNHSLEAGVCGFLVLGMAAETPKLTPAEKDIIVDTVVQTVAGRVPVIAGTSAGESFERVALVRRFHQLGCSGLMVNIPYVSDSAYLDELRELDTLEPGFIMVQDWDFKGYGLPIPLIVQLFEQIKAFRSLKVEVAPAGVKYTEVLKATQGRLHVTGGWAATQMIEALDRGVHAFMPTILHPIYIRIFNLHRAGRRDEAIEWFNKVLPVLSFSHQHLDISIHFNKKMVHSQGMFATDLVREPILPFDAFHQRVARGLIEYAIQLNEQALQFNKNDN